MELLVIHQYWRAFPGMRKGEKGLTFCYFFFGTGNQKQDLIHARQALCRVICIPKICFREASSHDDLHD